MPARKTKAPNKLPARARSGRFVHQLARGVVMVVTLQAAQIAMDEAATHRLFSRHLLDELHEPLTRYHE